MAFSKRGLRIVEGLVKYAKEKPQFYDTGIIFSKLKFLAANDSQFKAALTVDSSMCNGYDILHGGFMCSLMDVMTLYGHVASTGGRLSYTTNISINFMETAKVGDKIIAEAVTVKGGTSPIMESTLYKENGNIVAKGTASFVNGSEKLQRLVPEKFGFDVLQSD